MKKTVLLMLTVFMTFTVFAQEKGKPFILNEYVGMKIDTEEREYYKLFPYVSDFISAVFVRIDENNFRVIITFESGEETMFHFKDYTKNEIDAMVQRIESIGKMERKKMVSHIKEKTIEETVLPEPEKRFINMQDIEFTIAGNSGVIFDDDENGETKYFSKFNIGIGYFINNMTEIGMKGAFSKTEEEKGSGGLYGTFAVNIPTKYERIYYSLGLGLGFEIDEVYDRKKDKNVLDFDTQLEFSIGGKFFVSSRAAIILQPYYLRTFNNQPVKDAHDYGITYGISLFF